MFTIKHEVSCSLKDAEELTIKVLQNKLDSTLQITFGPFSDYRIEGDDSVTTWDEYSPNGSLINFETHKMLDIHKSIYETLKYLKGNV